MAYSITLAHSRGLLNDEQRDQWFNLVTSLGLSIDHDAFDEKLIGVATEAIKKTRDGKQRFAVPDKEFGKCVFLNDVPLEELQSVLRTHKAFVKSKYPGYEGQDAYVDAGDLGAEPEAYVNGNAKKADNSTDVNEDAASLKKNGINGVKKAAVSAGAVPVDGSGHVTNGVNGTVGA